MAYVGEVAQMGSEIFAVLKAHNASKQDSIEVVGNVFSALVPGQETPREVGVALMLEQPLDLITRLLRENAELRKGKEGD